MMTTSVIAILYFKLTDMKHFTLRDVDFSIKGYEKDNAISL